jgi:signal transduction histidine kinase
MSIVKEIVELHGGRVEILSQRGKGTTVTIWLAASPADEIGDRPFKSPVADESEVSV